MSPARTTESGYDGGMDQVCVKTAAAVGVKAADDDSRTFEAIVSVFGNVDMGGDVVMPGAFAKTLDRFAADGAPIPIVFAHQYDDPESHIGTVIEAKEIHAGDPLLPERLRANGGLWIKGKMDDEPRAEKVYRLLKSGRVREFSFSYNRWNTAQKTVTMPDGTEANGLFDIDLWEVGPVLRGMNPQTELLGVKAADSPSRPAPVAGPGDRDASGRLAHMRLLQTHLRTKGATL